MKRKINKEQSSRDLVLYCEAPAIKDDGLSLPCSDGRGTPRRGLVYLDMPGAPVLCWSHAELAKLLDNRE